MVRRWSDGPTANIDRALQIYPILIGLADHHEIKTYKWLGQKMGFGGPTNGAGVMGVKLEPLFRWCQKNQLPILTSLIVNELTGVPGHDLGIDNFPAEQQKVFATEWYAIVPPTADELTEALRLLGRTSTRDELHA